MVTLLTIIFVLVCMLLVLSILLQSGKGEGLSGTFGGTSQYLGGRTAATFLTKATTTLAAIFMLMSILLSMLGSRVYRVQQQTEAQRRLRETPAAQVAPVPGQEQPQQAGEATQTQEPQQGQ